MCDSANAHGRYIVVCRYRAENEQEVEVLSIDNESVRQQQMDKLTHLKATRDSAAAEAALEALTAGASDSSVNLLELAIEVRLPRGVSFFACSCPLRVPTYPRCLPPTMDCSHYFLPTHHIHTHTQAARARCTVGEISFALEKVWGRHTAPTNSATGAYIQEYGETNEIDHALETVKAFESQYGRRPRIIVAKVGAL